MAHPPKSYIEKTGGINLFCMKCTYKWLSRTFPEIPKLCPRCKLPKFWERKRGR